MAITQSQRFPAVSGRRRWGFMVKEPWFNHSSLTGDSSATKMKKKNHETPRKRSMFKCDYTVDFFLKGSPRLQCKAGLANK